MNRIIKLLLLSLLAAPACGEGVVIIGHPGVPKLGPAAIQKLYEGRIIAVGGVALSVVNLPPGSALRNRFLSTYLGQEEDQYTGYWTVRRFIGKGAPPLVLESAAEVIRHVQSQPGAVGYIDARDLRPGLNILAE